MHPYQPIIIVTKHHIYQIAMEKINQNVEIDLELLAWQMLCQSGVPAGIAGAPPPRHEVVKCDPIPGLGLNEVAFHRPLIPPPEAGRCFKIGFPWLRDHLDELLASGWTRKTLFGRGRYKWPYGYEWGAAWSSSWQDAHKTPGLGRRKGEIVFSFMVGDTLAQQSINLI